MTALTSAIVASPATSHLKRLSAIHSYLLGDLFVILERAEHLSELETIEIDQISLSGSQSVFTRFHESIVRNLRGLRVGHNNWDRPYFALPLLLQFTGGDCKLEEIELRDSADAEEVADFLSGGGLDCPKLAQLALPLGGLGARGACALLTSDRFPVTHQLAELHLLGSWGSAPVVVYVSRAFCTSASGSRPRRFSVRYTLIRMARVWAPRSLALP